MTRTWHIQQLKDGKWITLPETHPTQEDAYIEMMALRDDGATVRLVDCQ